MPIDWRSAGLKIGTEGVWKKRAEIAASDKIQKNLCEWPNKLFSQSAHRILHQVIAHCTVGQPNPGGLTCSFFNHPRVLVQDFC